MTRKALDKKKPHMHIGLKIMMKCRFANIHFFDGDSDLDSISDKVTCYINYCVESIIP